MTNSTETRPNADRPVFGWNETHDRSAAAGASMTGIQADYTSEAGRAYLDEVFSRPDLDWGDRRLARITRLRLLSDPGHPFWGVSYVHGEDVDGNPRRVRVPFDRLPKRGMRRAIVEEAKRDGVFAKGLGIFDAISTLC